LSSSVTIWRSPFEPHMVEAFSSVGRNPFANDHERIAAEIHLAGGMRYSELLKRNTHAMDKKTLDDILVTLTLMGAIRTMDIGGERGYQAMEET